MPLAPAVILAGAELGISIASEAIYLYQRAKEAANNGDLEDAEEYLKKARDKFTETTEETDAILERRRQEETQGEEEDKT